MSERCQWAKDVHRDPIVEPCWGPIETEYDDVQINGDDGPEWDTYKYQCCRGHADCALYDDPYKPEPVHKAPPIAPCTTTAESTPPSAPPAPTITRREPRSRDDTRRERIGGVMTPRGKIVASWKVTEEAEYLKLEAECCGYELVRVSYREIERGFSLGKAIRRP